MNMQTRALQNRRAKIAHRPGKVTPGMRLAISASHGGEDWLAPQGVALTYAGPKRRRKLQSCAATAAKSVRHFLASCVSFFS